MHGTIVFDTAQHLVYSLGSMKYVLIFALAVVIAKIDTVMRLFDKASVVVSRQKTKLTDPPVPTDIKSESELVSVKDDPTLRIDPHTRIISLMESYKLSPEPEIRLKIMEDIKIVPKMLTTTLDPALESVIYSWRDLFLNGHEDTMIFVLALENLLQGENQIMIRKFFSFMMDQNLENFLKSYSKSRDVTCKAAAYFGDPIPDLEKLNEYRERDEALETFLKKENLEPTLRTFASYCQQVIRNSLSPVVAPTPEATPTAAPVVPETPAVSP